MRPPVMKPYLVEVRFAYEVQADTADEALRLVSQMFQIAGQSASNILCERDLNRLSRGSPADDCMDSLNPCTRSPKRRRSWEQAEARSVSGLGISVRLGRRVLIPRSKIIAILNGEVQLDEQYLPAPVQSLAARRHDPRPKKSKLPEVTPLFNTAT